jgi:hypothetical protein
MTDVAKYLEDLKGPSKNKRFDACYYLEPVMHFSR